MRRKPSVNAPNITFDKIGEWDSFPNNTCDGIGSHAITLSTTDFDTNQFTIYPNPSNGTVKIDFEDASEKHTVQIFTILGQQVFEAEYNNSPSATITNLQKGIFLLKVKKGANSVTKKLIVN